MHSLIINVCACLLSAITTANPLVTELKSLFQLMETTKKASIDPEAFRNATTTTSGKDEDPSEWFLRFKDELQNDCPNISRLFEVQGYVINKCSCGYNYQQPEKLPFFYVALVADRDLSVSDLLEEHFLEKTLEDNNHFRCEGTGTAAVSHDKQTTQHGISSWPRVMLLQTSEEVKGTVKLERRITVSPKLNPILYELSSVLVYAGDRTSGHWKAYCLNSADKEWYCFNDANIRPAIFAEIQKLCNFAEYFTPAYFVYRQTGGQ